MLVKYFEISKPVQNVRVKNYLSNNMTARGMSFVGSSSSPETASAGRRAASGEGTANTS